MRAIIHHPRNRLRRGHAAAHQRQHRRPDGRVGDILRCHRTGTGQNMRATAANGDAGGGDSNAGHAATFAMADNGKSHNAALPVTVTSMITKLTRQILRKFMVSTLKPAERARCAKR